MLQWHLSEQEKKKVPVQGVNFGSQQGSQKESEEPGDLMTLGTSIMMYGIKLYSPAFVISD